MHRPATLLLLTVLGPALGAPGTPGSPPGTLAPPPGSAREVSAPAPREDYDEARAAAVSRVVADLEELAGRCQREKNYLQRNLTYEALLVFDPGHEEARKFLGYKWDRKAEEWTRKGEPKPPRDRNEEEAAAAANDREARLTRHATTMVELLERFAADLGPTRTRAEVRALLEAAPDDARLRALVGEVRMERNGRARWVPAEVARSYEARQAMEASRRAVLEAAPAPEADEPEAEEKGLGVEWKAVRTTPVVRVVGTVSPAECEKIARHVHALREWLPAILGETELPADQRIYVLSDMDDVRTLVANWPGLSDDARGYLPEVTSGWLGVRNRLGCWQDLDDGRLDQSVRQTISLWNLTEYGLTGRQGWVEQGMGLFLTERFLGTRLSFAIRDSDYSSTGRPEYADQIHDDAANFLKLARSMFRGANAPNLAACLGKDVNNMTTEDLLASYALSAWLIEGQEREVFHRILKRIGQGEAPVTVFESELGRRVPDVQADLLTWLEEASG